ncbi:MAG: GGDEF domain-containing protein [Myxococcaceae bacterium]|nr:GGDEF domain-containing protein [Myxococcaceae bacterium]
MLDHVAMLEGVTPAQREGLVKTGAQRRLTKGDVLISQGAPGTAMSFLVSGQLGVSLGEATADPIAVLGPGETVGELGVITGEAASAFVVALEDSEVLSLGEDEFWELVQSSHPFAVNLIVKLAERLRKNNATVSSNIEKRRLYERAAMFDGLTGIHNRRWLDETLHRLVTRHERDQESLCVALIDIDHFKKFNDTHGHDVGDLVLTTVASTLVKNLRPTDLVARFGGEEFVILFPQTTTQEAKLAGDRVRETVAQTLMKKPDGAALPHVTISMGIAALIHGEKPSDTLKAADLAMYEAKHGGRNQVRVAQR